MLEQLKTALDATELPFAFAAWSEAPSGDYGAYTPDGSHDLEADDVHAEQAVTGTVDYFTRSDGATAKAACSARSAVSPSAVQRIALMPAAL